jgi:outer membrane receptor protein involved in Fe transport
MRSAVLAGVITALCAPAMAQDQSEDETGPIEEIIATGTRIRDENIIAASPITTISQEEISLKQTPNIERVFRDMPITIPGDGENVNNGTAGQATLDLRGLGPERSLILVDGKRLSPYDINGIVTTDVIPINMLKRVDVVTGGASAVYGSDAMSGAVNFILRDDFEGFEIEYGYSETDSSQAEFGGGESSDYIGAIFGVAFDDGRGHMVLGGSRTERGSVLLGERSFGLFGVSSATGSGLGEPPPAPEAGCSGNTPFTTAMSSGVGSTTAMPGVLNLLSGSTYQFLDNGDLNEGQCARFNFNPFNYYQTPQERTQFTTIASYDYNDSVEFYGRATYSSNSSDFQIAPSGTFGQLFTIPVANPFFNAGVRQTILNDLGTFAGDFVTGLNADIADCEANLGGTCDQATLDALNAALAADPLGFGAAGIRDVNDNDVFDEGDEFRSTARRRTLELGPRTGIFDTDYYQYVLGVRGELFGAMEGWNYDVSYQRGVSDFVETRDGFTNLTNLQAGINTVSADQCITASGEVTGAPCTPINVFGPVGAITDEQRDSGYFIAIASDIRKATQEITHASISGTLDGVKLPTADSGLAVAFGLEQQKLTADSQPDECLKLAPASCQGGAGGNRLPVSGRYSSDEWFVEAAMPLIEGRSGFEKVDLELGFRSADYDVQGDTDSWKAGLSWEIFSGFRMRFMQQQAVRVANVGELFRPITTGLDNATFDPCSDGNPNPPAPGSELFDRCVATGMLPSQVGAVPDIISGQINVFFGTNPAALPSPEEADTTTVGFVWDTEFGSIPATISLDYYDIEINDYIDTPSGQEALDLCYVIGDPDCLSAVVRIGGQLSISGAGVPAYFTNFERFQAEGLDLVVNTAFDLGNVGELAVDFNAHKYLTNEFLTTSLSEVVDCNGIYGTSCDPVPEYRHTMRAQWMRNEFDASVLWRHIGSMDAQVNEADALFPDFRSVSANDYFDLTFGYTYNDMIRLSLLVANVFDEDPPILGNETGSTSFNSGNTFPSLFDTMGRVYNVAVRVTF